MASVELDVPRAASPLADTHAHLDMLEDPAGALARAALAGVSLVMTVVDPTEDADRTFRELDAWRSAAAEMVRGSLGRGSAEEPGPTLVGPPDVRMLVGAHPHNAKDVDDVARSRLSYFADHALVAGVGEIGLDFYRMHSPREKQIEAFESQLELAMRKQMPVVIHCRDAWEDMARILQSWAPCPPRHRGSG